MAESYPETEKAMWDQISALHACHREVLVEIQLLTLTEETGEAAEAFIGRHGLNRARGSAAAAMTAAPNWLM